MATKPKSSESQSPVQDAKLEVMLSKGLEHFNGGKLKEAEAAFAALEEEAIKRDELRIGRAAQGYLKAVRTRLANLETVAPQAAELLVQVELNNHDPEAALVQAEEGLKAHPEHCGLHYLKAVALAQLDQAQPAADALAKATSMEPGLIYQFRLEEDFDGVRHTAPFSVFNRG
jgi:outer membrane protein assembly factor BamD (BamD/ComL family)